MQRRFRYIPRSDAEPFSIISNGMLFHGRVYTGVNLHRSGKPGDFNVGYTAAGVVKPPGNDRNHAAGRGLVWEKNTTGSIRVAAKRVSLQGFAMQSEPLNGELNGQYVKYESG